MAATYEIIPRRVGQAGITSGTQVRKIQQLLLRAGVYKGAITGVWSQTEPAWIEFQKSMGWVPKPHVDPMDAEDRLAELASAADTLMYYPANLRGISALTYLVDYLIRQQVIYGYKHDGGGTRKLWGFRDREYLMIFGLQGAGEFPESGPTISVNCVTFANLLLGAWHGSIHQSPFDSGLEVGGAGKQLGERYSMPEVLNADKKQGFKSLKAITEAMLPDRIYHLASCESAGSLSTVHDMIVLNGIVYQANNPRMSTEAGAVFRLSLERQWQRTPSKHWRLFGPAAL